MELQWLTRYVEYSEEEWRAYCLHMLDSNPPKQKITVLQYRRRTADGRWWAEWQDIPSVDATGEPAK